jgi:hypothetical protein
MNLPIQTLLPSGDESLEQRTNYFGVLESASPKTISQPSHLGQSICLSAKAVNLDELLEDIVKLNSIELFSGKRTLC